MCYSLADCELADLLLVTAKDKCEKLIDEGEMSNMIGLDEKGRIELKETIENEYSNGTWEDIEVTYEIEVQVKVRVKSSKTIDFGRTDGC